MVFPQKVSTLPHTRYDQFMEVVGDFKEMQNHVDISICPCSTYRDIEAGSYLIKEEHKEEAAQVCSWPLFHKDIATMKETGKIVHVIQGQLVSDPLRDTRIGRKQKKAASLLDQDAIIKVVEQRAVDVVMHMTSRLEEKVYQEKDLQVIKNTRVLLSAHSMMLSVESRGASTVSNLTWEKFLVSSVEVDPSLLQRISEEQLRVQYREYVRRLESIAKEPGRKELSDIQVLELFLDPANENLYLDIEAVLSVMVRASLLISVESIVESWISFMEHHASQRRTLGERLLHEEMVIAINGPALVHCDSIVKVKNEFKSGMFINNLTFCPHFSSSF